VVLVLVTLKHNKTIYIPNLLPTKLDGLVIFPDGTKKYYSNSKLHKDNGPAVIEPFGRKEYYNNGLLHNSKGPAVIRDDGSQHYYLNGVYHSKEEWQEKRLQSLFTKWALSFKTTNKK
jgi:hypothetical protein